MQPSLNTPKWDVVPGHFMCVYCLLHPFFVGVGEARKDQSIGGVQHDIWVRKLSNNDMLLNLVYAKHGRCTWIGVRFAPLASDTGSETKQKRNALIHISTSRCNFVCQPPFASVIESGTKNNTSLSMGLRIYAFSFFVM